MKTPATGVVLASVVPRSPAARAGLLAGDCILSVNRQKIEDALDLAYAAAEETFFLTLLRNNTQKITCAIFRNPGKIWGGVAEAPPLKRCGNRCIFCFVDQMPSGLRPSLYIKDEDYRHSFLFGNYVTLTNLRPEEVRKIKRLKLSPLYVSVHATLPEERLRLLGRKQAPNIIALLRELGEVGIQFHTQIVVCPGWNDGSVLDQSIRDLANLHPWVRSIALVPVGLTAYRQGLTPLRPVKTVEAKQLLKKLNLWQKQYLRQLGTRLVFATDEWYLRAQKPLPSDQAYEHYAQLENGVGITRNFLQALERALLQLPQQVLPRRRILLPVGELAAPIIRRRLQPLNRVRGLEVIVVSVPNRFFGPTVTVTGLLSGRDILAALKPLQRPGDFVLLSPEPLRHEKKIFLDNLSLSSFRSQLKLPVRVVKSASALVRFSLAPGKRFLKTKTGLYTRHNRRLLK